jgi:hypothetical protein
MGNVYPGSVRSFMRRASEIRLAAASSPESAGRKKWEL